MPKKRRLDPLVTTFGNDSDCDFQDNQTIDGNKLTVDDKVDAVEGPIQSPQHSNQNNDNNCSVDGNHLTIDADNVSVIGNSAVGDGPANHEMNGQSLSPNLDENQSKLRRKSNRISKPIQRSLESSAANTSSTTNANSPNVSVHKKIVKQNLTQNQVTNGESDNTNNNNKNVVNRSTKASDESQHKTTSSKAGKSLRKPQMWTNEDTKWFFEAICEHGKDFPRIQSYMAQRCEKKGRPQDQIKNYEQVRHYYYRMWHKIANSMAPNEVVDKNIQEIYGLINYGEIWKKFGTKFDNKLSFSLQQLVNFGHTTFKVKKGRIRVKTPICNALKKIHKIQVAENLDQSLLNMPKEVSVELHPANNESWLRVHSLSQNPRVRTKMSLQKRLSSLIEYLDKRWNQSRLVDQECRSLCGTSLPANSAAANTGHDLCLRLRPQSTDHLNNVSLSKSYFNSSQMDLSLTAYLKTLYNQELKTKSKKSKKSKDSGGSKDTGIGDPNMKSPTSGEASIADGSDDGKPRETDDKQCGKDSTVDSLTKTMAADPSGNNKWSEGEGNKSDEDEPIGAAERSLALLQMLEKMNKMCSEEIHGTDEEDDKEEDDQNGTREEEDRDLPSPDTNAAVCLPEPPANATLGQWLSTGDGEQEDNDNEVEDKKIKATAEPLEENQISTLSADRARMGWSLREVGSMTIGELYLLFRCPKTGVRLEYIWEPIQQPNVDSLTNSADNEEPVVTSSDDTNGNKDVYKEDNNNSVSVADKADTNELLYRLLLAANASIQSMKRPANTSSARTDKKRRIKPTQVLVPSVSPPMIMKLNDNSSQMLSNVINNTIFNDNNNSSDGQQQAKPVNNLVANDLTATVVPDGMDQSKRHEFTVPTCPAPKAIQKAKTRNVCGATIQEALRQLQSYKYTRRQRRPTPKPVFGQIKPLLPRGSPQNITVSTATTPNGGQQQPIYVIPSQTLHHLNAAALSAVGAAVSNVTTQSSTQSLPMIDMTSLETIKSTSIGDTFNVILPQKAQQMQSDMTSTKTSVNQLIDGINATNIPLIQIDPISSVSVPIISSSISGSDVRYSEHNSTSLVSKSIPMFETIGGKCDHKSIDNDIEMKDKTDITDVLSTETVANNTNHQMISSSDESVDKLPLMSSNASITSLLEISLPEPPFGDNSCSSLTEGFTIEKRPFERLTLSANHMASGHHRYKPHQNTTDPTLMTASVSSSSLVSPPIDRHKMSSSPVGGGGGDSNHWLNGESCDLSIGTLLNACESPVKNVRYDTNDVSISQTILTDNSVDLMAKFADLAAQIVDTNSKST